MPSWQTQATQKDIKSLKSSKSNQSLNSQDGPHIGTSFLLDIPSETLTGITSYLDPPSLLSVGTVNKSLYEHIKKDNTWHRAFVCQFLGIGPECETNDSSKMLMLRMSENLWRNEFCARYRLRRRWRRSLNGTIMHTPVHSPISGTHIMLGQFLLSSSLQYGIVARSYPFTGKILPGFLDASGVRTGRGIGNPNAEFSPNVTACILTSDGGTAKILWGYRNGEVAITTAERAMEPGRLVAADFIRCTVGDQHEGAVLNAAWDEVPNTTVVTAGADGLVKVWDAKKVRCLWTSEKNPKNLVPDACIKVIAAFRCGYIVGVMRSGEVVVWSGLNFQSLDASAEMSVIETRISHAELALNKDGDSHGPYDTVTLHVDTHAQSPTILVAYPNDSHFSRLRIGKESSKVEITHFGDPSFGSIATLSPYFSSGSSFVLVGDHMGSVSVYDWHAHPADDTPVPPATSFEAHEDGSSVTALTWNGVTLITGSARGAVEVWDGLTFEHLRSVMPRASRTRGRGIAAQGEQRDRDVVTRVLIGPEKDALIASIGDRILAWRAGPVVGTGGGVRGRHSAGEGKRKVDKGMTKYFKQIEMHQIINESRSLLKIESEQTQRRNRRERAQRARLESMGLDEAEAVDYLLMLSRDEAMEETNGFSAMTSADTESVFEGDFDEISSAASATSSHRSQMVTTSFSEQKISVQGLENFASGSNQRSHTSSRHNPDSMQSCSSPRSSPSKEARTTPISVGISTKANDASIRSDATQRSNMRMSTESASPRFVQSAWNIPLAQSTRSPPRVSSIRHVPVSPPHDARNHGHSPPQIASLPEEMDDDMRFAIELSLAEARSRGEDI